MLAVQGTRSFFVIASVGIGCSGAPPVTTARTEPLPVHAVAAALDPIPDAGAAASAPPDAAEVADAPPLPPPGSLDPVPAWQAFAVAPARSTMDRPHPPWADRTVIGIELEAFDGTRVTGKVVLVAAPGLDVTTCAVEVVWTGRRNQGARLVAPPVLVGNGGAPGVRAVWKFTTPAVASSTLVGATAFAFCPLNNAHVDRPWGVTFTTGETFVAGPRTRAAYCESLRPPTDRAIDSRIEGRRQFKLAFACGSLIRRRGRTIIDDCKGDVLLAFDALAADLTAEVAAEGTPLTLEELRNWHGQGRWCGQIELNSSSTFGPGANQVFAAFIKRAGKRLVRAVHEDRRIHRFDHR